MRALGPLRTRSRRRSLLRLSAGVLALAWGVSVRADDVGFVVGPNDLEFVFGRSPTLFQDHPDAVATRLGVWFEGSWVDNDREPDRADLNYFNVLLDTRWRSFQGFVEVEYERETGLDGSDEEKEFEVEQAYLRYQPRDALSLRLGRFNTPAGIWLPIHWSILMDTIEKPPIAAKELLPEQQLGFEISGTVFPRWLEPLDGQLEYAVFAGMGSDELGQDDVTGVTAGADLRARLRERYLVGATLYHQKNDRADDRNEYDALLYGEAQLPGSLTFRAEYLHQRRQRPDDARWAKTLDVGYAKLRWDFARWFYLNYRVSYGDDDLHRQRTARQLINTFTFGIQPVPAVRIKLEYAIHDFHEVSGQDFRFWGTSLGVSF